MTRSFRVAVAWLLAAEACYAVMRVTARLSATASTLPWAEIAAVRFLGGSLVPLLSARVRRVPLRVADARNAWLRSLFGTGGALSLFYALAIFRVRRLSAHESSEAIGFHMSLTAGVIRLLIALPNLEGIPREAIVPLCASALAGGVGQTIVARAYAREAASRLAAFNYAGVVFTYLLEAALFRRIPEPHQIAGALIVIGAGVAVSVTAARSVGAGPLE